MRSAAKVGILVVVFVGMLFGAYAMLGRSLFANPGDRYFATLSDASGIAVGTRVLVAGVKVGSVTAVELVSPRQARLTLELNKGVRLANGSRLEVPSSLIGIGDVALQIVAPAQGTTGWLAVGSTLPGGKANAIDAFLPEGRDTIKELNKTLIAFRELLHDTKLRNGVNELLASSNKTIASFGLLATRMDATIAQNQSEINKTVVTVRKVVEDVHRASTSIAKMIDEGKIKKDTYALLDNFKSITEKADKLVASLNDLVNDPKLREPMAASAANLQKMTDSGTRMAANAEKIVQDGTVVSKNAIVLSEQAKEIAAHAIEIEKQLQGVLDKVGGFFQKPTNGGLLSGMTTGLDLTRESNPAHWRTDFSLTYPLSDGKLHVGIWDAFETNKLTFQFGRTVNPKFDYRYGIYASKPGVGVDFSLAPRFGLRGDLWDINSPRLDLRARYDIGNGLIGWIGMDRVFNANAPSIGFGVRR